MQLPDFQHFKQEQRPQCKPIRLGNFHLLLELKGVTKLWQVSNRNFLGWFKESKNYQQSTGNEVEVFSSDKIRLLQKFLGQLSIDTKVEIIVFR